MVQIITPAQLGKTQLNTLPPMENNRHNKPPDYYSTSTKGVGAFRLVNVSGTIWLTRVRKKDNPNDKAKEVEPTKATHRALRTPIILNSFYVQKKI